MMKFRCGSVFSIAVSALIVGCGAHSDGSDTGTQAAGGEGKPTDDESAAAPQYDDASSTEPGSQDTSGAATAGPEVSPGAATAQPSATAPASTTPVSTAPVTTVPTTGTIAPSGSATTGSSADEPTPAAACFDPVLLEACEDSAAPPDAPHELLRASDLGDGYEFTELADQGVLARSGDDWVLVWLVPRADDPFWIVSLNWPDAGEFELQGLAFVTGEYRVVLRGCDENENCALLTFDEDPDEGNATLYALDEPVDLERAPRIGTLFGYLCVYGAGLQCKFDSGWQQVIDEDVHILALRDRLALDDAGRVYELEAESDVSWIAKRIDSAAQFRDLDEDVALAEDGTLLYAAGDGWKECATESVIAAGIGTALHSDGTLVVQTWRYPSQPCRESVPLGSQTLIASASYTCGYSKNWLLLTPTTLWAALGRLGCAIG